MRAIPQSSQFNSNLRMAKWADPFPDTGWGKKKKITLCKVGSKFPPTFTRDLPHSTPIYNAVWVVVFFFFFSNDTPGIGCDSFLRLMGGDTQGVAGAGRTPPHQRLESRGAAGSRPRTAAWPSVRIHVRVHISHGLFGSPSVCAVRARFSVCVSGVRESNVLTVRGNPPNARLHFSYCFLWRAGSGFFLTKA